MSCAQGSSRVDVDTGRRRRDGAVSGHGDTAVIGPQSSDGGGRWVLPDALIRDMHDGGGVEDFQHPTALLQVRRRRLKSGHFGGVIVLESRAGITAIDLPLILVFQPCPQAVDGLIPTAERPPRCAIPAVASWYRCPRRGRDKRTIDRHGKAAARLRGEQSEVKAAGREVAVLPHQAGVGPEYAT